MPFTREGSIAAGSAPSAFCTALRLLNIVPRRRRATRRAAQEEPSQLLGRATVIGRERLPYVLEKN